MLALGGVLGTSSNFKKALLGFLMAFSLRSMDDKVKPCQVSSDLNCRIDVWPETEMTNAVLYQPSMHLTTIHLPMSILRELFHSQVAFSSREKSCDDIIT